MKIEFIGHGLLKSAKGTVGDFLCSSFNDDKYDSFIGFSAFTTYSGLKEILPYLNKNKDRFKELKFYLGIAELGTTKEALECLIENNIETYYYQSDNNIMHQKIFYFFGNKYHRLIIGSANLTKPGLFGTIQSGNIEGSIKIEFTSSDSSGMKIVNQIFEYFETIVNTENEFVNALTKESIIELLNKKVIKGEWENSGINTTNSKSKKSFQKIDLTDIGKQETEEKKEKIYEYKITQYYLDTWDELFLEFKTFKSRNNDNVTIPSDQGKLYQWYRKQKIFYLNGEIPERHLDLLIQENFYFGDNHDIAWAKAWEDKYKELLKFYIEHGHSWVKRRKNKIDPLKSLSDWCAMQRTYYRQKSLDEYRIERLEEINYVWEPPSFGLLPDDDSWFERYLELQQFKKKYGHCHPPQVNPNKTSNKLGRWVNDQTNLKNNGRKKYNSNELIYLDPIREEYLTDLGVDWNHEQNKHKKAFEEQIQEFLNFKKEYPNLKPPTGESKKERDWKAQMKHKFDNLPKWKQERLLEERIL